MIVAIDATKKDGLSLIKFLEDYPDGWLRAEWVAREDYAPTVQLEKAEEEAKSWRTIAMNHLDARAKAECRIKKLEDHLAMIGQIESHKRVPDYVDAVEMYSNHNNPSASAKAH